MKSRKWLQKNIGQCKRMVWLLFMCSPVTHSWHDEANNVKSVKNVNSKKEASKLHLSQSLILLVPRFFNL